MSAVEPTYREPSFEDFLNLVPRIVLSHIGALRSEYSKVWGQPDEASAVSSVIATSTLWLGAQKSTRIAEYDIMPRSQELAPHLDWNKVTFVKVVEFQFAYSELDRMDQDEADLIRALTKEQFRLGRDFFVLYQYLHIEGAEGTEVTEAEHAVLTNAAHEAMAEVGALSDLDGEYVSFSMDGSTRSVMSSAAKDRVTAEQSIELLDDELIHSTISSWAADYD